jgi:hypothetical protein
MDKVLVTLNHSLSVRLWVVPGFIRRGVLYDDADVLDALRIMLTIKSVVYDALQRAYVKVKQFESSGASVYCALPRHPPSFWGYNATPCALYSLLAIGKMRLKFHGVPTSLLMGMMWNVIVPEKCPRCDETDEWALDGERILCYGCSYSMY